MNRRQVSLHVLCMAAMLLILFACSRNDVLDYSHESMREFEAHVKWVVDQIKERVDLRPLSVQASVSNAFEKARKRKKCGANYGVVPVYCSIGEDDFRRDQLPAFYLFKSGQGTAFVEIDGSVVEYELAPGQQIVVDTGILAAMTETCTMNIQQIKGVKNVLLGGEGLFNTVITGPGKVYLQSMPIYSLAKSIIPYIPRGN